MADPWIAVRGLVNLLESTPEDGIAARATALLAPDGWLAAACRERRAGEDLETLLTRRCLTWKTTERYLAPVLEFAQATGHEHARPPRRRGAAEARARPRGPPRSTWRRATGARTT